MSLRRYITYPLIGLLIAVFIGAGLFILADTLLPGLIENRIVSILKNDVGISEITLNLNELGLRGADLGPLRLGSPKNPALAIGSLHVGYSPGELYRGKVKNIVAGGVELHVEYRNGKAGLRGFDLAELFSRFDATASHDTASDNSSFAFFPQRIEINSATLLFDINGQIHRIPFEVVAVKETGAVPILNVLIDMYPQGQVVNISGLVNLGQNRVTAQLAAQRMNLLRFTDLFESVAGMDVSGYVGLEINSDFILDPFSISAINGQLKGSAIVVGGGGFQFRNPSDQQQHEQPLVVDFEKSEGPDWRVTLSNVDVEGPLVAQITNMAATVKPQADQYDISGHLKLSIEPPDATANGSVPIRLNKPFDLPLQFSGRYFKSDAWQFGLKGGGNQKGEQNEVGVDYDQYHIATRSPEVTLTGSSRGGRISASLKLKAPEVRISSSQTSLIFPQLVLTGDTAIGDSNARGTATSTINLEIPGMKLTSDTIRMEADRLGAVCTLQTDNAGIRQMDGHVKFSGGHLTDTHGTFELARMKGNIPLEFPAGPTEKKGRVDIESVRYQALKIGAVGADLKQTASGLSFDGNLKSTLIPALSATFSGNIPPGYPEDNDVLAHIEIVYPETGPEVDLGKLLPAAGGFTFKGKLIETGDLVIAEKGISGTATTRISDGTIEHHQKKLSVQGIQMDLSIRDLVNMRSAPAQRLKFAHASFGEMDIENAAIDFQIESTQSILIEKSRFTWCDGKVEAPAIRFTSGTQDYNLILYCDRLNLAQVLRQFGAANEKAEGRLSGRIPLRYQNGQLSFEDGFLYTTPGESGKIRMTDTEMLTAGIPPDTPQYVQMELARKALEDYDYSWAKLNLTTEGEDLLIKMQLDGKPAKSLPFVYQKELGGFAKVEADVQGSTFQGIRLDVNFRLPLNKLMQYKELIQLITNSRE